jgi:hypothetical protein
MRAGERDGTGLVRCDECKGLFRPVTARTRQVPRHYELRIRVALAARDEAAADRGAWQAMGAAEVA